MFLFWKWKELYFGNSCSRYSAIRTALADNNIKCSCKSIRRDDSPPFRSPVRNMIGRVGENQDVATMYYIYVYKSDYEKARYFCRGDS